MSVLKTLKWLITSMGPKPRALKTLEWVRANIAPGQMIDPAISLLTAKGFVCEEMTGRSEWSNREIVKTINCHQKMEKHLFGHMDVSIGIGVGKSGEILDFGTAAHIVSW